MDLTKYGHENEASNGVNVDLLGKLLIWLRIWGCRVGRGWKTKRAKSWICLNWGWISGPVRLIGV